MVHTVSGYMAIRSHCCSEAEPKRPGYGLNIFDTAEATKERLENQSNQVGVAE
jgi:hypothetical protein